MNDLPNLIVISQVVPESAHAGSLLMYRLLKHYPPDRLLVIGPPTHGESAILSCRYETLHVPLERLERTRFSRLVFTLRSLSTLPRPSVKDLEGRLHGFRPHGVITVMQAEAYYALAADFAFRHSLPLALIVHDLIEEFEVVFPFARFAQTRRNKRIYRAAARRFCISPAMNERLAATYGASGEVLYPNRSEELTARHPSANTELKNPERLTIGYAGSLSYGYGRQLARMLPAFAETGTRLRIYSAGRLSEESGNVSYLGRAITPEETWARVKDECDVVVLPYTWDADYRALYETHFPSKLPEYLALGMPVLVFGPPSAAGVRWVQAHPDSGWVVTNDTEAAWTAALHTLRDDADLRQRLAAGALREGNTDFDPVQIRASFISAMGEMASSERK